LNEDLLAYIIVAIIGYLPLHYGLFLRKKLFLYDKKYESLRTWFSPLPPIFGYWLLRIIMLLGGILLYFIIIYKLLDFLLYGVKIE